MIWHRSCVTIDWRRRSQGRTHLSWSRWRPPPRARETGTEHLLIVDARLARGRVTLCCESKQPRSWAAAFWEARDPAGKRRPAAHRRAWRGRAVEMEVGPPDRPGHATQEHGRVGRRRPGPFGRRRGDSPEGSDFVYSASPPHPGVRAWGRPYREGIRPCPTSWIRRAASSGKRLFTSF